jgi:hypothetical protein
LNSKILDAFTVVENLNSVTAKERISKSREAKRYAGGQMIDYVDQPILRSNKDEVTASTRNLDLVIERRPASLAFQETNFASELFPKEQRPATSASLHRRFASDIK